MVFIFFAKVSCLSAVSFGEVGEQLDRGPFIGITFVLQQDTDKGGLLFISFLQAHREKGIRQGSFEGRVHKRDILRCEGLQIKPSDKTFWEHAAEKVPCAAGIVEQELEKGVVGFGVCFFHPAKIGHVRAGSRPEKQGMYHRVKGFFGGFYKDKPIIIKDLNFDISWFARCIRRSVETMHALSPPEVMTYFYWAAFLEKIISRQVAKPQRGKKMFFFASLRLCERKIILRKAAKLQKGRRCFLCVFFAPLRLCERKIILRKAAKPQKGRRCFSLRLCVFAREKIF